MKQVSLENHPSIFKWPEINLSPLVVKISPLQLRSSVFTHRRSFGKTRDWVQSCLSTIGSITHVYSKMTGDYRWVFCANPTSNCRNLEIFTPFSLSERKFYFVWFFHQVRKSRTLKIFVIQHWSFVLFLTSRNGSFFFFTVNDNNENAYLQQVTRFQFMYVFHVSQHSYVEGFSFLHIIGYKARFWSYTYTILVLWFAINV